MSARNSLLFSKHFVTNWHTKIAYFGSIHINDNLTSQIITIVTSSFFLLNGLLELSRSINGNYFFNITSSLPWRTNAKQKKMKIKKIYKNSRHHWSSMRLLHFLQRILNTINPNSINHIGIVNLTALPVRPSILAQWLFLSSRINRVPLIRQLTRIQNFLISLMQKNKTWLSFRRSLIAKEFKPWLSILELFSLADSGQQVWLWKENLLTNKANRSIPENLTSGQSLDALGNTIVAPKMALIYTLSTQNFYLQGQSIIMRSFNKPETPNQSKKNAINKNLNKNVSIKIKLDHNDRFMRLIKLIKKMKKKNISLIFKKLRGANLEIIKNKVIISSLKKKLFFKLNYKKSHFKNMNHYVFLQALNTTNKPKLSPTPLAVNSFASSITRITKKTQKNNITRWAELKYTKKGKKIESNFGNKYNAQLLNWWLFKGGSYLAGPQAKKIHLPKIAFKKRFHFSIPRVLQMQIFHYPKIKTWNLNRTSQFNQHYPIVAKARLKAFINFVQFFSFGAQYLLKGSQTKWPILKGGQEALMSNEKTLSLKIKPASFFNRNSKCNLHAPIWLKEGWMSNYHYNLIWYIFILNPNFRSLISSMSIDFISLGFPNSIRLHSQKQSILGYASELQSLIAIRSRSLLGFTFKLKGPLKKKVARSITILRERGGTYRKSIGFNQKEAKLQILTKLGIVGCTINIL